MKIQADVKGRPTIDYQRYIRGNKKVTDADIKFIEKYLIPQFDEDQVVVWNSISGFEQLTDPLIATAVRLIQELSISEFGSYALQKWGISEGGKIQVFDRARMLVLKLDSEIYMNVID